MGIQEIIKVLQINLRIGILEKSTMTKRIILIILFTAINSMMSDGCSRTTHDQIAPPVVSVGPAWLKTYNGITCGNRFFSVRRTSDGGFVAAGETSIRIGSSYASIVKLDADGNIQWQRAFEEKYQKFYMARQTQDNGYLASGVGLLVKLGPDGSVVWQQKYTGLEFRSFVQTNDGGFTLIGGSTVIVIVHVGSDGSLQWQRVYGEGEGQFIQQTSDGGCISLAKIWNRRQWEALILKIDAAGAVQWQKRYGGTLKSVEQTTDGGFLFAGTANFAIKKVFGAPFYINNRPVPNGPNAVNVQGWLLRLNPYGEELWQRQFGGVFEDEFTAMRKTIDGMFIIAGNTESYGSGNKDIWLVKLNQEGSVLWQRAIGGSYRGITHDVEQAEDGGYVVVSTALDFGYCVEKAVLLKVSSDGEVPGCSSPLSVLLNEASEDARIETVQLPSLGPGQGMNLVPTPAALSSINPGVSAANICPALPKPCLFTNIIQVGPSSANALNRIQDMIVNQGAAVLSVHEMKISQVDSRGNWFAKAWAWIMAKLASYSVSHNCSNVEPAHTCNFTVEFKSRLSGQTDLQLTIISNDPVAPVLTVPIHATVL